MKIFLQKVILSAVPEQYIKIYKYFMNNCIYRCSIIISRASSNIIKCNIFPIFVGILIIFWKVYHIDAVTHLKNNSVSGFLFADIEQQKRHYQLASSKVIKGCLYGYYISSRQVFN